VLIIHPFSVYLSHRVCKPAYLVPVPSQDKLEGLCKEGHPAYKWWGWQRWGHQLVWMGWQSIQIVGASACVIFSLLQKIQKMAKCTFCYRLTRVVPDKVHRAVKLLCVVCSIYLRMFATFAVLVLLLFLYFHCCR